MQLPVTVIGGYLGAGKTTLVNHLLRHNEGLRLAVLVNEFGDLPIDADLIEGEKDGLLSISGGCVCCAFGSDLIGALEDVRDMDRRPDHILIEASGVALPASIATTVGLVEGLRADAVVVLADAEQIRANARHKYLADTIDRQLRQADILLLTKTDLVDAPTLETVAGWLRERVPGVRIVPVRQGEVPATAILGSLPLPARRPGQEGAGAHGLFASVVLEAPEDIDPALLARGLADDPGVTRAKGFLQTPEGLMLLHVVGARGTVEPSSGSHPVGIVCIGLKSEFDPDRIAALPSRCRRPA